jgi:hypothetical protein
MELCRITESNIRLPRIVRFIVIEPSDIEFQVATMCKDFLDEVLQVVATCNIKWIRRRRIEIESRKVSCQKHDIPFFGE